LRGARANKPFDFQGGEAFAQVILRRAITTGNAVTRLIILGGSARKDYATRDYAPGYLARSKGVQLLLLLCGQLDDVLRIAVPDGLRGASNRLVVDNPLGA
jgi:hypothetical protein